MHRWKGKSVIKSYHSPKRVMRDEADEEMNGFTHVVAFFGQRLVSHGSAQVLPYTDDDVMIYLS